MRKKIAIFASGSGKNAEAITKYFRDSDSVEIALLICNKPDAYVLQRMDALGVPTIVLPKPEWTSREKGGHGGENALKLLRQHKIDLIVLAGFLPIVPDTLMEHYSERIVNIHPSLLPKFGGKGMWGHHVHEAVLAAGEKESGITVHIVTSEIDGGKPLFQARCEVLPTDTPDTLAERVHNLEHMYFPEVIAKWASETPCAVQ